MPWSVTSPMYERQRFVLDAEPTPAALAELCLQRGAPPRGPASTPASGALCPVRSLLRPTTPAHHLPGAVRDPARLDQRGHSME